MHKPFSATYSFMIFHLFWFRIFNLNLAFQLCISQILQSSFGSWTASYKHLQTTAEPSQIKNMHLYYLVSSLFLHMSSKVTMELVIWSRGRMSFFLFLDKLLHGSCSYVPWYNPSGWNLSAWQGMWQCSHCKSSEVDSGLALINNVKMGMTTACTSLSTTSWRGIEISFNHNIVIPCYCTIDVSQVRINVC